MFIGNIWQSRCAGRTWGPCKLKPSYLFTVIFTDSPNVSLYRVDQVKKEILDLLVQMDHQVLMEILAWLEREDLQ